MVTVATGGGSGDDGDNGNDRMQIDGRSSSVAGCTQYNLFGMSDDGMSTDRGTGNTANVQNAAGSSSSSIQHSMAEGSGRDVTDSAGSEQPNKKKGKRRSMGAHQRAALERRLATEGERAN